MANPNILFLALIFFFGAIFGSFLNVLIYRLPRKISVIKPRSFCPHCNETIKWYQNIPIFSFLIQGGKCGKCNLSISPSYIVIEILTASLWLITFYQFEASISALELSLLASLMLVIAFIDWSHQIIPSRLIYIALVIRLIFGGFFTSNFWFIIRGGIFCGVFFAIIYFLAYFPKKREGLGFGDVRLAILIGAWIGVLEAGIVFFTGSFLAMLFWVGLSLKSGFERNRRIPFAPFLVVSTISIELLSLKIDLLRWLIPIPF